MSKIFQIIVFAIVGFVAAGAGETLLKRITDQSSITWSSDLKEIMEGIDGDAFDRFNAILERMGSLNKDNMKKQATTQSDEQTTIENDSKSREQILADNEDYDNSNIGNAAKTKPAKQLKDTSNDETVYDVELDYLVEIDRCNNRMLDAF